MTKEEEAQEAAYNAIAAASEELKGIKAIPREFLDLLKDKYLETGSQTLVNAEAKRLAAFYRQLEAESVAPDYLQEAAYKVIDSIEAELGDVKLLPIDFLQRIETILLETGDVAAAEARALEEALLYQYTEQQYSVLSEAQSLGLDVTDLIKAMASGSQQDIASVLDRLSKAIVAATKAQGGALAGADLKFLGTIWEKIALELKGLRIATEKVQEYDEEIEEVRNDWYWGICWDALGRRL